MNVDDKVHLEITPLEYVMQPAKAGDTECKLGFVKGDKTQVDFSRIIGYVNQYDFETPQQGFALQLDSTKAAVTMGAMAGFQAAGALVLAAASLLAF